MALQVPSALHPGANLPVLNSAVWSHSAQSAIQDAGKTFICSTISTAKPHAAKGPACSWRIWQGKEAAWHFHLPAFTGLVTQSFISLHAFSKRVAVIIVEMVPDLNDTIIYWAPTGDQTVGLPWWKHQIWAHNAFQILLSELQIANLKYVCFLLLGNMRGQGIGSKKWYIDVRDTKNHIV